MSGMLWIAACAAITAFRISQYRPTLFALGALLATTTLIVGSSAKESLSQSPEGACVLALSGLS